MTTLLAILGILAAILYFASAVMWWRAAKRRMPAIEMGYGGVFPPDSPYLAYLRNVGRDNAWAAGLSAAASLTAGIVAGLSLLP